MHASDMTISSFQIREGDFYALPHEERFMQQQTASIKKKRKDLAAHIRESMRQSSETWHDNAPAEALFGEMKPLDTLESKFTIAKRHLTLVEYPEPSLKQVTIGSRVGCLIAQDSFYLDITGNLPVTLETDGDVESGSVVAPMPNALLGAKAGQAVLATINERIIEIDVISVDQTSQRAFYENIL